MLPGCEVTTLTSLTSWLVGSSSSSDDESPEESSVAWVSTNYTLTIIIGINVKETRTMAPRSWGSLGPQ